MLLLTAPLWKRAEIKNKDQSAPNQNEPRPQFNEPMHPITIDPKNCARWNARVLLLKCTNMSALKCTNACVEMHQCLRWHALMPALKCTNACVEMHQCLRWDAPMPLWKWNAAPVEMEEYPKHVEYILRKGRDCQANEGEKIEKKQGRFVDCLKYRIPEHRSILFWLSMVMAFVFFLGCSLSTSCMVSRFLVSQTDEKCRKHDFLNQWMHPNYSKLLSPFYITKSWLFNELADTFSWI